MAEANGKIISAWEAIGRIVQDGDQLVIGNDTIAAGLPHNEVKYLHGANRLALTAARPPAKSH